MPGTTFTTASVLKAILCFIDAEKTPKIAYDNDSLSAPLIAKVKNALGDKDGSQDVSITFGNSDEDKALEEQFSGVCYNISRIFGTVSRCTS